MRFKLILICALIALPAGRARALFNESFAGTSSGEFLKLGADARGIAMGSAMTAVADDAAAIYWNPAGLSQLDQRHLTGSYSILFQDVTHGFMAYAHPIQPLVPARRREYRPSGRGTLAVAILYLNAGQLVEIDNTGAKTGGAFNPRDAAIMAGWGASLTENFDFGLTLKFVESRIRSSARAGSADLGLRWRGHLSEFPYVFALNGRNLFGKLNFRSQQDPLPLSLRIGQSLKPTEYWLLSADIVFPRDNDWYPAFGTELSYPVQGPDINVAIRGGWNGRLSSSELDGMANITIGGGLGIRRFLVDYAWMPFGVLGHTHRFSLALQF